VIVEKNGGVFARVKEGSKEDAEAGALSLCARRWGGRLPGARRGLQEGVLGARRDGHRSQQMEGGALA
jgi:hypothetical protein